MSQLRCHLPGTRLALATHQHGLDPATSSRLATAYEKRDGCLVVTDPPDGQWSRRPLFPDGSGGLVSTADDMIAFGRMLLRGGGPVLTPRTVAEMTRDQLTAAQRANVWPGFGFLDSRGWGYGLSVLDDGRCTWEGGLGIAWSNVPSQDLTVVVLTQRALTKPGCRRVRQRAVRCPPRVAHGLRPARQHG